MTNIVTLLLSINFIRWLLAINAVILFTPFPAFVKTLIMGSSFTFISTIVLLLRLPAWMFVGIIRYRTVRGFYDFAFSLGLFILALGSGSVIFVLTSAVTGLMLLCS